MGNDERDDAKIESHLAKRSVERNARDDAGQRDREHDHQAQRFASKELESLHGKGGCGAEHQRDQRGDDGGLEAHHQRIARAWVV